VKEKNQHEKHAFGIGMKGLQPGMDFLGRVVPHRVPIEVVRVVGMAAEVYWLLWIEGGQLIQISKIVEF